MSNIKLKPCPFCNSAAKFSKDRFGLYAVKCSKCGCMTEFQFDFGEGEDISQKKAADIWNRRAENETD